MDDKPQIDFERLKQIQEDRKKKDNPKPSKNIETPTWILTDNGWVKKEDLTSEQKSKITPHPSLTDPYWYRRQLINVDDFDEWANN